MEYDDSQIGLEVDGKIWSGENYGFQSKESHDKLFVAGKLNPVQQGIDRFGNYLTTSAQADPIVGPVLNFLGAGVRTITNVLPEPIKQGAGFVLDKNQEAAENIAAATGLPVSLTDPMTIADAAMGGAVTATRPAVKTAVRETLQGATTIGRNLPPPGPQLIPAGAGAAPSVQLNVSGGKANLTPKVMEITVDPKFRAPGMVEGVAQQPEFRDALDRRTVALKEVRANIDRRIAEGKPPSKYIKEEAGKGSTLDYNPNDVIVFEKKRYKVYDPLDPQRYAQQHHLFAKAQSYPFVEKMEDLIAKGIADEDDLVAMFAWADMLDVTMGNTRKNMLDAPGRSHIDAAVGATEFDKTRNIHTVLKDFDLELTRKQVSKIVADAKDATDLMERFNNYIVESVKPQKKVAQRIVEDFLVRHRASLPTEQLAMFDDLSSKLGGRIQR